MWQHAPSQPDSAALQQLSEACCDTQAGPHTRADRRTCHSLAQLCGQACAHPRHPYAHWWGNPHFQGSPPRYPCETCGSGPGLHQPCPLPLSSAGLPLQRLCGPYIPQYQHVILCTAVYIPYISPHQHDLSCTAVYVRQAAVTRSAAALSVALAL